jgi:type IV pilus assembly protein PilE
MRHNQSGWTLLEVVVVLSLTLILTSIALPSYRSFIERSNVNQAEIRLLQIASHLEDYHAMNNSYKGATLKKILPNTLHNMHYQFKVKTLKQDYYLLQAIPIGKQKINPCGMLSIDSFDTKLAQNNDCWMN